MTDERIVLSGGGVNTARPEHQIVPFPRFAVRCVCGFAHDSNAETEETAIVEIGEQHRCTQNAFTAKAYPR